MALWCDPPLCGAWWVPLPQHSATSSMSGPEDPTHDDHMSIRCMNWGAASPKWTRNEELHCSSNSNNYNHHFAVVGDKESVLNLLEVCHYHKTRTSTTCHHQNRIVNARRSWNAVGGENREASSLQQNPKSQLPPELLLPPTLPPPLRQRTPPRLQLQTLPSAGYPNVCPTPILYRNFRIMTNLRHTTEYFENSLASTDVHFSPQQLSSASLTLKVPTETPNPWKTATYSHRGL